MITPAIATAPLSEDYVTDGPKFRELVSRFCRDENGQPIVLDNWQAWLIDRCLERYPDNYPDPEKAGRLRYRRVLVSVARRNGKSLLGSLFALYGLLMHERQVVGIASDRRQAQIVFNETTGMIERHPLLKARFKKTERRGLERIDKPGKYICLPAQERALQGYDVGLGIADEGHLLAPELWSAMVKGTSARADGLVVMITTAGDENSLLLKSLYEQAELSAEGHPDYERFGAFIWQGAPGAAVDDPEALRAANPSTGATRPNRVTVSVLQEQVRGEPENAARRYTLNQFVRSESAWLPLSVWARANGHEGLPGKGVTFSLAMTKDWKYATITAAAKVDGVIRTAFVQQLIDPNTDALVEACAGLKTKECQFVMPGYQLGMIADALRDKGMEVRTLTRPELSQAAAFTYNAIATGRAKHDNDPSINTQLPFVQAKMTGDTIALKSSEPIDGVLAMVAGVFAADTYKKVSLVF